MDLPATVLVGVGAIIAASITGTVSFINLITSKDQKTSEFRQEWINSLRDDIAEFLAHVVTVFDMLSAKSKLIESEVMPLEHCSEVADSLLDAVKKANELYKGSACG
jgi:hypothetical protein